jgi:putative phage-type endonuclease
MSITAEQRAERRKYLGSSDAAAILGLDPFMAPSDVYLSKVYDVMEEERPCEAIVVGHALESALLSWASEKLGVPVHPGKTKYHSNGIMIANLDGEVGDDTIVECKTAGILNRFAPLEEWGDAESDRIPEKYFVQCQHQAAVVGPHVKTIHVPALIGGRGLQMFHVTRDDELIGMLEEKEVAWWKKHIEQKLQPNDAAPCMDIIKRIRREPNKTVQVETSLFANWIETKEILSVATKKADDAKALLVASLGDAEAGECELGMVTYFEQSRKGFEVAPTTFRVLRQKKQKGA